MNDDVGKAGSSNTKIAHFSWGNGVINSGMWSFDVARMVFSEVGSSAEILKINHEKKTGLFEIEFVIEKTYDEKNKVTTYKTQKFTLKKLSEDRLEILDTDYVFGMPAEKDDRFYLYRISGPAL